jgi:Polysaccharide deacetylase
MAVMRPVDRESVARDSAPTPVRPRVLAALLAIAVLMAGVIVGCEPDDRGAGSATATPRQVPVLAYHGVTTDAGVVTDEADPRYHAVRLAELERQMKDLHDAGYETITPSDYVSWLRGEEVRLPAKPIVLTFDDGQTSAELATPVLERYGFEAVMYVVSGFADGAFGGPSGEPGWYLTWDQLRDMRATGAWIMQFHAGPRGHAHIDDPRDPTCHRFYSCRFGEDEATWRERVKSDVAQGLGALRTAFDLPDGWQGSTYAVPWDDTVTSEPTPDPWLPAYFADEFPVVFVQESWTGPANNQRYRHEVHNPESIAEFRSALSSPRFAR